MKKINKSVLFVLILFVAVFSVYAASVIESDSTIISKEQINSVNSGCFDSDGGVYPYVAGYCNENGGGRNYDAGLSANGAGPSDTGVYASETFCLTTEMRQYCKNFHSAFYCDSLPDSCYRLSLLPLSANLAWNYFPFKEEYLCTVGFANGACLVPVCGDGIINGYEQCDGSNRFL